MWKKVEKCIFIIRRAFALWGVRHNMPLHSSWRLEIQECQDTFTKEIFPVSLLICILCFFKHHYTELDFDYWLLRCILLFKLISAAEI